MEELHLSERPSRDQNSARCESALKIRDTSSTCPSRTAPEAPRVWGTFLSSHAYVRLWKSQIIAHKCKIIWKSVQKLQQTHFKRQTCPRRASPSPTANWSWTQQGCRAGCQWLLHPGPCTQPGRDQQPLPLAGFRGRTQRRGVHFFVVFGFPTLASAGQPRPTAGSEGRRREKDSFPGDRGLC